MLNWTLEHKSQPKLLKCYLTIKTFMKQLATIKNKWKPYPLMETIKKGKVENITKNNNNNINAKVLTRNQLKTLIDPIINFKKFSYSLVT